MPYLDKNLRRVQFLANIFICLQTLTIVLALCQIKQNKSLQKVSMTMDMVNEVYSPDFITSFNNIVNNKGEDLDKDYSRVFNIYYKIAVYYNKSVIDTSIIKKAINLGLPDFIESTSYKVHVSDKELNAKQEIERMHKSF